MRITSGGLAGSALNPPIGAAFLNAASVHPPGRDDHGVPFAPAKARDVFEALFRQQEETGEEY
jgi:hypothetical protein